MAGDDVPGDADGDGPAVAVEVAADQRGPLDGDGRQQHVDAHGAVAVPLEERHQEAEADEDHHVHVLEHWRGKQWI